MAKATISKNKSQCLASGPTCRQEKRLSPPLPLGHKNRGGQLVGCAASRPLIRRRAPPLPAALRAELLAGLPRARLANAPQAEAIEFREPNLKAPGGLNPAIEDLQIGTQCGAGPGDL